MQYNLFPSADMILSLRKECGTENWEPYVRVEVKVDAPCQPVRIKRHAPLDMHNVKYMKQLKSKPSKDFIQVSLWSLFMSVSTVSSCFISFSFIQDNIRTVREESERVQRPKAAVFSLGLCGEEPQLMYSSHTFKSREQVKEILRDHLAQVCGDAPMLHFLVQLN